MTQGGEASLTLDDARGIATRLDAEQELVNAAAKEQDDLASEAAHFRHLGASDVLRLWETGLNERGRRLSPFEIRALGERWGMLTGHLLPDLGKGTAPAAPVPAMPPAPVPADDTMLRTREVLRITGLSLTTLKRYVNGIGGTFPQPVKLSPRAQRWKAGVVKAWLAEREAASDYQPPRRGGPGARSRGRLH